MRTLSVFILIVLSAAVHAQNYPQGYFRNPLGIPISLAGNFGECRPGHFHMGLDLKTGGRENLPVFAAAGGYVSRIKTEPGGFGHAIYLTHPAGYTTVYAHLNDFFPLLQKHLRRLQYARKSWVIDETLEPNLFSIIQGQQIAWSGNTGGSSAPHLHFEIRDTKTERALNPQLFGFDIPDHRAPVPTAIALYDLRSSIYATTPSIRGIVKSGEDYRPTDEVLIAQGDSMGIGVIVDDFMDGSTNTLAFLTAELYVADELGLRIALDDIGYDETRFLHAYADYRMMHRGGRWIQCLFRLPGNALTRIYEEGAVTRGVFRLGADTVPVRIVLKDAAGNSSTITFRLRLSEVEQAEECNGTELRFSPNAPRRVEELNIRYSLPAGAVYDEVCALQKRTPPSTGMLSGQYAVGSAEVPVHTTFPLSIKPMKPVPFAARQKVVLMYSDGKKATGKAAVAEAGGWYSASVRAFGDYWLAVDTVAPVLKPIGSVAGNLRGKKSLAFTVTDARTSVKSFRGEVDGQWVLFEQHGNTWTYSFDEYCPPGTHSLFVTATDEAGNKTFRRHTFTR